MNNWVLVFSVNALIAEKRACGRLLRVGSVLPNGSTVKWDAGSTGSLNTPRDMAVSVFDSDLLVDRQPPPF